MPVQTNVRQVAFLVRLTRWSTNALVTIGIDRAVYVRRTDHWFRTASYAQIIRIAFVIDATLTARGMITRHAVCIWTTPDTRASIETFRYVINIDTFGG